MKIFEEGDLVRLQLAEVSNNTGKVISMKFDFTVEKKRFHGLADHIIEHLTEAKKRIKIE